MSTKPAVVFVVDDDPFVRKAIERLVRSAGMDAITYASAQEYIDSFDAERGGCLVLDLSMPGIGGLELQQVLESRSAAPPIIFLTGYGDVQVTVAAMKRGAVEFLTKPVDDHVLLDAIRSALAKDHADRLSRTALAEIRSRLDTLTPRELEVLRHVISGRLNKQIAADLGTVEKTIKVHRSHLMQKLQVKSVAALVRLAGQAGTIPSHRDPGEPFQHR